ncbi:hypothetical protein HHK36_017204 [Tetracentron sinense]|uniref:Uncharacterized protein n=1 Tax=Tetracentron sinense TaxID=13715 RepID=A0A834Z221_TETSI|nr:hypothetical protein HHK36_017204 [Tetracentron sinense]
MDSDEAYLVSAVEMSEKRVAKQEATQRRTVSAQPVLISNERDQSMNQIPFLVLEKLMSLRYKGDVWKQNLDKFINQQAILLGCRLSPITETSDPLHLLQLLRTKLLEVPPYIRKKWRSDGKIKNDCLSFHSVMELSSVGISCQRSSTCYLRDVQFQSGIYGMLSLPPITIDDSTRPLLLNLIAYKTCPDAPDDSAITSYICFMHALINRADDVKELRSKGILLNFHGSDEQVADLFTKLSTDLVPDVDEPYGVVNGRIEKYYHSKMIPISLRIWMVDSFFISVAKFCLVCVDDDFQIVATYANSTHDNSTRQVKMPDLADCLTPRQVFGDVLSAMQTYVLDIGS